MWLLPKIFVFAFARCSNGRKIKGVKCRRNCFWWHFVTGIAACLQAPDNLIIRYISSCRQGFRQNRCKQVNNRRYMQKTLTNCCQRWIGRMYALLNGSVSRAQIARSGNENKKNNVSVVGADYLCRSCHEGKTKGRL